MSLSRIFVVLLVFSALYEVSAQESCENAFDFGLISEADRFCENLQSYANGVDPAAVDNCAEGTNALYYRFSTGANVWSIQTTYTINTFTGNANAFMYVINEDEFPCGEPSTVVECEVNPNINALVWTNGIAVQPFTNYRIVIAKIDGVRNNFDLCVENPDESGVCNDELFIPFPDLIGEENKVCRVVSTEKFNTEVAIAAGSDCDPINGVVTTFTASEISADGIVHIEINTPTIPSPLIQLDTDNCQDGLVSSVCFAGEADGFTDLSFTRATPGSSWNVSIASNIEDLRGDFEVCTYVEPISIDCTQPKNDFCTLDEDLMVLSREEDGPLGGPYCPGEEITFRYSLNSYRLDPLGKDGDCNGLKGIVPVFGPAWDQTTFNSLLNPTADSPLQVDWRIFDQGEAIYQNDNPAIKTFTDEDGFISLCSDCDQSDCAPGAPNLSNGDPLPLGWYAYHFYSAENGVANLNAQAGDITLDYSPAIDGFILPVPVCRQTEFVGPYLVEFSIRLKEEVDCINNPNSNDASVNMFIFSDNEMTGSGLPHPCMTDRPELLDIELPCPQVVEAFENNVLVNGTELIKCSGDALNLTVSSEIGTPEWVVDSQVTGLSNGSGNNLTATLENLGANPVTTNITFSSSGGTATDGCGSSIPSDVTITVFPNPDFDVQPIATPCRGTDVDLVAISSFPGDYTFDWSNGMTGEVITFENLTESQDLILTVTDNASGCTQEVPYRLEPAIPELDADIIGITTLCAAGASTTLRGNDGFVRYDWTDGDGNILAGGLNTQTFTVSELITVFLEAEDSQGCISIESVEITEEPLPAPDILGDLIVCQENVSTVLTAPAGDFGYEWTDQAGNVVSSAVSYTAMPGTYQLRIFNDFNCESISDPFEVAYFDRAEPVITSELPFCESRTIRVSVGNGSFTSFVWSTGETSPDIEVTLDRDIDLSVTVTDGTTDCEAVAEFDRSLVEPEPSIEISAPTLALCGDDASTVLSVPNTFDIYEWFEVDANTGATFSVGQNDSNYTADRSGTYRIIATDAAGCEAMDEIEVVKGDIDPPAIEPTLEVCADQPTVQIGVPFEDGVQYEWFDADMNSIGNTSLITQGSGTYTLQVTNALGCNNQSTTTIIENALPTPILESSGDLCVQNEIFLNVVDQAYQSYTWLDQNVVIATTTVPELLVTLPATTTIYSVEVLDDNGCRNSVDLEINPDEVELVSVEGLREICQERPTTLSVRVDPSFTTYEWILDGVDVGNNSPNIDISEAGIYTLIVTNDQDCSSPPREIEIVDLSTDPLDFPALIEICNESIDTMLLAPENLLVDWTLPNGTISNNRFVNAEPGTYELVVSNTAGCISQTIIEVAYFEETDVTIQGQSEFCLDPGASITLEAVGNYDSYLWDDGSTLSSLTVDRSGVYDVIAFDANGCSSTASFPVMANELPEIEDLYSLVEEFCEGASTELILSGAEAEYALDLDNDGVFDRTEANAFTQVINTESEIVLRVTNAAGCSDQIILNTRINELPDLSSLPLDAAYCVDGSTTITAPDGLDSYAWSLDGQLISGENDNEIVVSTPGAYTLMVIDASQCSNSAEINVTQSDELLPTIVGEDICDATTVMLDAGAGFDAYVWTNASGDVLGNDQTLSVNSGGTYFVQVSDFASNCEGDADIIIQEFTSPEVPMLMDQFICNDPENLQNLEFILDIAQQTTGFSGSWNNLDNLPLNVNLNSNSLDFTGVPVGDYRLEFLTDNAQGPCENQTALLTITVGDCNCPSTALALPLPLCNESGSGMIDLADYVITSESGTWSQTSGPENRVINGNFDLEGAPAGAYELQYSIENVVDNCVPTATIVLNVVDPPSPGVVMMAAVLCDNEPDDVNLFDLLEGEDAGGIWTEISDVPSDVMITADGLISSDGMAPGTYDFSYAIDGGDFCSDVESVVTVEIQGIPSIAFVAPEMLTCGMTEVMIDASGSSSGDNLIYSWSDPSMTVIPGETSSTIAVGMAGNYTLEILDTETGCMVSDQIEVLQEVSIPSFDVTSSNPSCEGVSDGTIELIDISGGVGDLQYSIDNGNTYQSTPFFQGLRPNDYNVRIIDEEGCETAAELVRITTPLSIAVNAGEDQNLARNQMVNLFLDTNVPEDEIADVIWTNVSTDEVICAGADCQTFEFTAVQGFNTYCATLTTVNGCVAEDCMLVRADVDFDFYVPEVIKWDAEDYSNRFFFVQGNDDIVQVNSIKIWDRWGQIVYAAENIEPNNPDIGWDGTDRLARIAQGQTDEAVNDYTVGVYMYQVYVQFANEPFPVLKRGALTVLR